jgi:hypothetical protein
MLFTVHFPSFFDESQRYQTRRFRVIWACGIIPIAIFNPYLAGGMLVDYLVRSRYPLIPKNPPQLAPENLSALTASAQSTQNPDSPEEKTNAVAVFQSESIAAKSAVNSGMKAIVATHE